MWTYQGHLPEFAVLLCVAGCRQRAVANDIVRVSTMDSSTRLVPGRRTLVVSQAQLQSAYRKIYFYWKRGENEAVHWRSVPFYIPREGTSRIQESSSYHKSLRVVIDFLFLSKSNRRIQHSQAMLLIYFHYSDRKDWELLRFLFFFFVFVFFFFSPWLVFSGA